MNICLSEYELFSDISPRRRCAGFSPSPDRLPDPRSARPIAKFDPGGQSANSAPSRLRQDLASYGPSIIHSCEATDGPAERYMVTSSDAGCCQWRRKALFFQYVGCVAIGDRPPLPNCINQRVIMLGYIFAGCRSAAPCAGCCLARRRCRGALRAGGDFPIPTGPGGLRLSNVL
jgi:hypothetical protein